jgi:hypothetical protein
MNVTLELKPEIEHRVTAEAAARGVSVEAYLTSLIEDRALLLGPETITPEQFEADMDLLADGSERLPVLPPDAFSRESIYADHD